MIGIKTWLYNLSKTKIYIPKTLTSEVYDRVGGTSLDQIIEKNNNNISDAYRDQKTYAVGDYCIYNNSLYKCITEITTAESFDSAKWKLTSINDILGNTDISSIGDGTVTGAVNTLNDNLTTKLVSNYGSSTPVDGGTFNYLTTYRVGKIIFVYGSYKITKSVGNYIDIFQINDAYLPTLDVEGACARSNDATYRRFTIYKNGLVRLQPRGDASGVYYFNAVYSI